MFVNHGNDSKLWDRFFRQEKKFTTSTITRLNLCVHRAADFQVVHLKNVDLPAFLANTPTNSRLNQEGLSDLGT